MMQCLVCAGVLLSQRTAAGGGGAACTQLPGGPHTSSRKPDEVRTLDKSGDRDTGHRGWQGAGVHLLYPARHNRCSAVS